MDVSGKRQQSKKCRQYKGISMRKWGKWVAEVRMPKTRSKIWLGSYDTAEQAARAFDAAVYCIRGPNAKFNFPNTIPAIPSATSLSRQEIQLVAAKYALDQIPALDRCLLTEESASPSASGSSSCVSETEAASDGNVVHEEQDLTWDNLLRDSYMNFERYPSFDDARFLQLTSYDDVTEEQVDTEASQSLFFDSADLWNFELF
ncbi:hypothetical protein SUGI_0127250 [Cryptomeria japonica]|uniref:ethylene-responsive transcription factor ERF017 n=1 Tax=Cryptomeria japonica TaxID=3369 RepID=UPI002408BA50|nr:ethylene-responsive transcription factor ERF017 [Cryptomeria japonica]GLJ10386.1 hypothetical protein SUGI_0127250 [Cryptomeria japonica]